MKDGIDLVFASTWLPENRSVKLIKKSDYDNCIQMAQKNYKGNQFSKGNSLNDFINYCDRQMNEQNEFNKNSIEDSMLKKRMGSTTIYRNELRCKNDNFYMKPYRNQIWPSYMGILGNGMANTE